MAENKFRVGDRVLAKSGEPRGCIGTIIEDDGTATPYLVAFEGWTDGHDGGRRHKLMTDCAWWCGASSIELIDQPKFKVGDRVRVHGHPYHLDIDLGTITGRCSPGYRGEWDVDLDNYGDLTFFESEMTHAPIPWGAPAATPQPAIVALIEGGTNGSKVAKPATRPFVHSNEAAATAEAERLAKANPGQEFGVYVLTASRTAEVSMKSKDYGRAA